MNEYVPNWRKRFRSSTVTWYEHKCNIEYNNAHACPLDNTNLSLLLHEGFLLLNCMNSPNKTCAIGAHPMGAPGCPEFAFSTISALNTLIVSIHFTLWLLSRDSCLAFLAGDSCDILWNVTAWEMHWGNCTGETMQQPRNFTVGMNPGPYPIPSLFDDCNHPANPGGPPPTTTLSNPAFDSSLLSLCSI